MRNNYFFILIFLLLSSCKESGKTEKTTNKESREIFNDKKSKSDTIFLSLSTNMNNHEFERALKLENGKRLNDGEFQISIDDEILNFHVDRIKSAIVLSYSQSILENELSDSNYLTLFEELFTIFNSNYVHHNNADFPNQINQDDLTNTYVYANPRNNKINQLGNDLTHYGLKETNYAVFNDSLKTVVLAFSIRDKGLRKFTVGEAIRMSGAGGGKKEHVEHDGMHMFEFNISIYYYLNQDFYKLKKEIKKDIANFNASERIKIQEHEDAVKKYKNKLERNKSEL